MQNPVAEPACTHRGARSAQCLQQRILRASAAFHQIQVALAGGINEDKFPRGVSLDSANVICVPVQLKSEVVHDGPRRTGSSRHGAAAESIQRLHFEVLLEQMERLLINKGIAIVRQAAWHSRECAGLFIAYQRLCWRDASDLIIEPLLIVALSHPEFAGRKIHIGQPHLLSALENRRQKIVRVRVQQIQIADRPGANDLGDGALDDFPWLWVAGLFGYRYPFPMANQFSDVAFGGMERHPAHGNAIALGQRHI